MQLYISGCGSRATFEPSLYPKLVKWASRAEPSSVNHRAAPSRARLGFPALHSTLPPCSEIRKGEGGQLASYWLTGHCAATGRAVQVASVDRRVAAHHTTDLFGLAFF
jgi:hypothetical protein